MNCLYFLRCAVFSAADRDSSDTARSDAVGSRDFVVMGAGASDRGRETPSGLLASDSMPAATPTFGTLGAWLRFATRVDARAGVHDRLVVVDLSHPRSPGSRRSTHHGCRLG
jgi:hypothetical protein